MSRKLIGTLLVLASATGYAFLPIFAKLAYREGLGALDLVTWRFIIATLVIWLLWPAWRHTARLRASGRRGLMVMLGLGLLFAVLAGFGFAGLELVPAATYSLIFYTYPALVALFSLALGERLPPVGWVALGLALVGAALTAGGQLVLNSALGIVFVLINAALYAAYIIIVARQARRISGLGTGALVMTGTMLVLLLLTPLRGLGAPQTAGGWMAALGLGVIGTVLPILALIGGIHYLGAPSAAVLSTIEPALTIVLAAVLLGENILPVQIIGGLLILTSAVLLNLSPHTAVPLPPEQTAA